MSKWNCPKCNELIDSFDLFCRNCGNKFHQSFSYPTLQTNGLGDKK